MQIFALAQRRLAAISVLRNFVHALQIIKFNESASSSRSVQVKVSEQFFVKVELRKALMFRDPVARVIGAREKLSNSLRADSRYLASVIL